MLEGTDIEALENLAAEKLGTLEVEVTTSASGKVCLIVTENPFEECRKIRVAQFCLQNVYNLYTIRYRTVTNCNLRLRLDLDLD